VGIPPIPLPIPLPPTDPAFITTMLSLWLQKRFNENYTLPPKSFKITGSKNKVVEYYDTNNNLEAVWTEEFETPVNGTYSLNWVEDEADIATYTNGEYTLYARRVPTACQRY
jgi:hypothetical protein